MYNMGEGWSTLPELVAKMKDRLEALIVQRADPDLLAIRPTFQVQINHSHGFRGSLHFWERCPHPPHRLHWSGSTFSWLMSMGSTKCELPDWYQTECGEARQGTRAQLQLPEVSREGTLLYLLPTQQESPTGPCRRNPNGPLISSQ